MNFTTPNYVAEIVWSLRQADWKRSENRAAINRLFDGAQPWSKAEADKAGISTNVNWLDAAKLDADARRSLSRAFFTPAQFFKVGIDRGPAHKRNLWANTITTGLRRAMKGSIEYFELMHSQFAQMVLHGKGPCFWADQDRWVPLDVGLDDVLIPSPVHRSFRDLEYFAVFRQFTPMELHQKTRHPDAEKLGWNLKLVEEALKWAVEETGRNMNVPWQYERAEQLDQLWIADSGLFASDASPTIDCWDVYFWGDTGDNAGWRRRMIIDTASAQMPTSGRNRNVPDKNMIGSAQDQWLFNSGERVVAEDVRQLLHFQYGDLSAVAPFLFHTVRGFGKLLYSVCYIVNRLKCQMTDALFESLLQYFWLTNPEDHERITQIVLQNHGGIPEGVKFVKPEERWQINAPFLELGLSEYKGMMMEAAAQYREGRDTSTQGQAKTATQIMAEVNAANALMSGMLLQAYEYQKFQYEEVCRRFCRKNSIDRDVKRFRTDVLREGVPEELLEVECWDIQPERVLGGGNQTMALAAIDKLMATYQLHDPEAQREILQLHDLTVTGDSGMAVRLTPMEEKEVSGSVRDAQLMMGSLMQGIPVAPKRTDNPQEVIEVLLSGMALFIQRIQQQTGGMATPEVVGGLILTANTAAQYIGLLDQNKEAKLLVKQFNDELKRITNLIKAYQQRLAEAAQQQPGGNGGLDPTVAAKLQGEMLKAQAKAQNMRESHAQKTQQRQAQFEQQIAQRDAEHRADMAKKLRETQVNVAAKDLETAGNLRRNRFNAFGEDGGE